MTSPLLYYPLGLLLVSESPSFIVSVEGALRAYGQLPALAHNLEEAVAMAVGSRWPFDGIMVDRQLSTGMNKPALAMLDGCTMVSVVEPGAGKQEIESLLLAMTEKKLREPDILSDSVIDSIFSGHRNDYQQALDIFRDQVLPEVLALPGDIAAGQTPQETLRAVHRLKSSAYVIGANKLGNILQCINAGLQRDNDCPIDRVMQELGSSARSVREILASMHAR